MIDHVLGRPSVQFRKIQVLAVVSFWSFYLYRGDRHGPPLVRRLSGLLSSRLTVWQTVLVTLLYLYVARNFGKLVGLECPEPLASLYSRSYFRATWVTTALDAGFWSAMKIKRKGLRDVLSVVFSLYYLICAEQADEKVRKIRATLTVDHLRVAWNKGTTPYLSALTNLMRPRLMCYPPRKIRIPRPKGSSYHDPVVAWLYFNGPISALKKHDKMVLDIPGGGFVAMDPRNHDDKLMGWAAKTGLPVLSLDYRKAPEWPYPYALNECYDVYHTLVATRGRCLGLSGDQVPNIVVSGDSAGGNLAVAMVLMILQTASTATRRWQGEHELPPPVGCMLIYPALDMNIGNWMTDEQMALIRDRRVRKTNRPILRHKSDDYRHLAPNTPYGSDDSGSEDEKPKARITNGNTPTSEPVLTSPQTMIKLSAAHTNKDSAVHTKDAAAHTKDAAAAHTKDAAAHTKDTATAHTKDAAAHTKDAAAHTKDTATAHTKDTATAHTKDTATAHTKDTATAHTKDAAAHPTTDSTALPHINTNLTNRHTVATPDHLSPVATRASPETPRVFQPPAAGPAPPATAIKTRLATSSMISYFNDRILTPEMMRAMIILYIGPHHRPDFSTDFLLSPLLAPESLLARFPRTWMLTGERDPLVDDTVIFAGRLRQAKRAEFTTAKELGLDWARGTFREEDWVNVDLVPGISHGFLQFVGVFPEGWKYIYRCGKWIDEAFAAAEGREVLDSAAATPWQRSSRDDYFGSTVATPGLADAIEGLRSPDARRARHHYRSGTASSADEDRPLEMTLLRKDKPKLTPPQEHGTAATAAPDRTVRGRGRVRKSERGRRKSLVSLASEDDLLGRRMKGLTGGLGGEGLLD